MSCGSVVLDYLTVFHFRGTILDEQTGKPIGGATVHFICRRGDAGRGGCEWSVSAVPGAVGGWAVGWGIAGGGCSL